MKSIKRFTDTNYTLAGFRDKIHCECPKCSNLLTLHGLPHWKITQAKGTCSKCSYTCSLERNSNWSGPVFGYGKQACFHCGHKWVEKRIRKEKWKPTLNSNYEVECSKCQKVNKVKVSWSAIRYTNESIDPYFGFKLFLQTQISNHLLWAYNETHLGVLKSYVSADIREKNGVAKWTMITRLPSWMKQRGNQSAIEKAINKMEAKLLKAVQK